MSDGFNLDALDRDATAKLVSAQAKVISQLNAEIVGLRRDLGRRDVLIERLRTNAARNTALLDAAFDAGFRG